MNNVRIIGGTCRGKILTFPNEPGLRPTPNRVRETLFNWLMHDIRAATCLDAFAGSGALGFEALSRGAKKVIFIEQNKKIFKALQHNATLFPSSLHAGIDVLHDSVEHYLLHTIFCFFDLIFMDPPFDHLHFFESSFLDQWLPLLSEDGKLYIESPTELSLNPSLWQTLKKKKTGQVYSALYQKQRPNNN